VGGSDGGKKEMRRCAEVSTVRSGWPGGKKGQFTRPTDSHWPVLMRRRKSSLMLLS
jgi:hypothetical protein